MEIDTVFTIIGLFAVLLVCLIVLLAMSGLCQITITNTKTGKETVYGSNKDEGQHPPGAT